MGIISKLYTFTTGIISPTEVNADLDQLFNELNGNIQAVNIEDGAITDGKMATAVKPVTRYDECFQNHVASGLTSSTDVLDASIAVGTAYIDGVRVVTSAVSSNTCDDETVTYVDLSKTGAFSWNENASPAANYMRLYGFTSTGGAITATENIRPITAVGADEIEVDAATKVHSTRNVDTSPTTTSTAYINLLDLGPIPVLDGDELVITAQANVSAAGANEVYLQVLVDGVNTGIFTRETVDAVQIRRTPRIQTVHLVASDNTALPVILQWKANSDAQELTASQISLIVVRYRR